MFDNPFKRGAPKPQPSDEEIARQRAGRFGLIGAAIGGVLVAKDMLSASPAQAEGRQGEPMKPEWVAYLNARKNPISAHTFLGSDSIAETKDLVRDLIHDYIPSEDVGRVNGVRDRSHYTYTEPGLSYQYIGADDEMVWRKFGYVGGEKNTFYLDYVYTEGPSANPATGYESISKIIIYDSAGEFQVAINAKTGEVDEFSLRKQNDAGIQAALEWRDADVLETGWSSIDTPAGLFIHYSEGLKDPANANRYVLQRPTSETLKSPRVQQFVNGLLSYPFAKV